MKTMLKLILGLTILAALLAPLAVTGYIMSGVHLDLPAPTLTLNSLDIALPELSSQSWRLPAAVQPLVAVAWLPSQGILFQNPGGDKFVLGRYHEAVLEHGSVPVKYLPELVRARFGLRP